ncbi:MAG: DUF2924 domain-containing protein [Nitrospiraceae bacterium]
MQEDAEALIAELARLSQLSHADLSARWFELYGNELKGARRELLIRGIAYKLQEQAHGALSEACRARLRRLRAAFKRDPSYQPRKNLKPGTQLTREWRGELHEVTILEAGFSYRERTFESLSEIARAITGTRWSGPTFFGLNRSGPRHASRKAKKPSKKAAIDRSSLRTPAKAEREGPPHGC